MSSDQNPASSARLEVFVEPFKENNPGPHVIAAIEAMEANGLSPDMGPFATTAEGTLQQVMAAMHELTEAGFAAGAKSIQLRVERL